MFTQEGKGKDFWYDESELNSSTIFILQKQSVTCCGFLGGDTILLFSSFGDLRKYLHSLSPQLPYEERSSLSSQSSSHELERRIFDLSVHLEQFSDKQIISEISGWEDIIRKIPQLLWFSSGPDLFRYSFSPLGTIHSFLQLKSYPSILIACLKWWYDHEAESEEKEVFYKINELDELLFPIDRDLIIKGINLYNHGTYEMTGLL